MAKNRVCLECSGYPIIKGKSWGSHKKNKHKGGNEVKWEYTDCCSQSANEIPNIQEQIYPNNEIITVDKSSISLTASDDNKCNVGAGSTQPNSSSDLFRSLRKTRQQELEEKILFLEGKLNEVSNCSPERSHFTISDLPSGVGSANKLTQEDFHKQCNKFIEEKDKCIKQLEEKLNSQKECKIKLKQQLQQQKEEYEYNLQLKEQHIEKVRIEAYNQGMEVLKQVYEICKDKAEREQIKDIVMQKFSCTNSINQSPQYSCIHSQDGSVDLKIQSDIEDEQMQIDTNGEEKIINKNSTLSTSIQCPYCTCITSKSLQEHYLECDLKKRFNDVIGKYGSQWKIQIEDEQFNHITEYTQSKQMFADFTQELTGNELQGVKQLQEDLFESDDIDIQTLHGEHYCRFCKNDFTSFGTRFQHYQSCLNLKQHYENIKAQLKTYKNKVEEEEGKKIQTAIDFDGNLLKGVIDSVNMIKELTPLEKQAKEVWGDDYKKMLDLYKQFHSKDYFNSLVQNLIVRPVADADGNPIYAQNTTRENLLSMLGKNKKSRKSNASLENEVITMLKQQTGVTLTLDERRRLEAQDIKCILKQHDKDMLQIQDYLNHFRGMQSKEPFEKVNRIFCDGIILPRMEQLFSTYIDFEAAFHSAGIQVQKISPAQKEGFVYVRLLDSANAFTIEFVVKLNAFIQNLRMKLEEKKNTQEVINGCFVWQIDCSQDIKGFFLSFDVKRDIEELSKLMKMDLTRDYLTFESLFTLLNKHNYGTEECPQILKQRRFKIYNKLLHFLESEQGKKKISMNLKALLNCSSQFYQKFLECADSGVSRLEFSHYFYSFEESQEIQVKQYQQEIDHAFKQINKLPQVRYQVPFKSFFEYFWNSSKAVFIFQKDSWTVIYAKHSKSAYVGQTVKITSNRFKNENKIDVVKRFAIPSRWCTVVDNTSGKVQKVMKSGKRSMQIPIQSLNTVHTKFYDFDFNPEVFKYHLRDNELDEIQMILQSGQLFKFSENTMQQESKRNQKQKQKEETKEMKNRVNITNQLKRGRDRKSNWIEYLGYKFNAQDKGGFKYQCKYNECDVSVIRKGKEYWLIGEHPH